MELYAKVRYAVQIEGLSKRAAARRFGIDAKTVDKMMRFSVPPGYRRRKPPVRPKLGQYIAIIDKILADDKGQPKKQQHTAKRIFERLRGEHGYRGGRPCGGRIGEIGHVGRSISATRRSCIAENEVSPPEDLMRLLHADPRERVTGKRSAGPVVRERGGRRRARTSSRRSCSRRPAPGSGR